MTMTQGEGRKNAGCWWLTADPSRRLSETRRYAWEFVAFDDQEVGVPAPHNSARARVLRSLARGPGSARRLRSDRPHSRLKSSQVG